MAEQRTHKPLVTGSNPVVATLYKVVYTRSNCEFFVLWMNAMTTAYFTDTRFERHTLDGHPEYAGRLIAIQKRLEVSGIVHDFTLLAPREATPEDLQRVHAADYLEILAKISAQEHIIGIDADTYVLPESYQLARIAAGGLLNVVDEVMEKRSDNGLAAIRPPGHHATPTRGMGFCLVNNIAIAARYAQAKFGLKRVAIVDFDVHHGNGTQDAFYDDPSVYFISTHQFPLYPGTGSIFEIGDAAGHRYNLNIPLPAGSGDTAFETLFQRVITPALVRFQPELVLVSAGFDAHWRDPLANLQVSLSMFAIMSRWLIQSAQSLCEGRVIFVTEGGYDLEVLSNGVLNVGYALLGRDTVQDPIGKAKRDQPLENRFLEQLMMLHELG